MSGYGLGNTSMFADKSRNFGISASDYVPRPTSMRLSENINDYVSGFGSFTDSNGVITGKMPSKAAFDAVDVTGAPKVFNEKGLFDWSVNKAGGLGNVYVPSSTEWNAIRQSYNNLGGAEKLGMDLSTWAGSQGIAEPGFMDKAMDFLGSDSMKGLGTLAGIGTDIFGIMNANKAQKQAKKQWGAENARADELMAINREKYNTYKADKARLNSQY